MSAVSEVIVREFFELHGFLVRQQRKFIGPGRREEEEIDFFAVNPAPRARAGGLPFILLAEDVPAITRAVIVVKGWHTETFSPGMLANSADHLRVVEPAKLQRAARTFAGDGPVMKLLILPALPQGDELRAQSIELLKALGIDAVMPFHTLLADLINQVEVNRNYQKSDLLQMIRILKNYDFFKEPQLELFKARRREKKSAAPAQAAVDEKTGEESPVSSP